MVFLREQTQDITTLLLPLPSGAVLHQWKSREPAMLISLEECGEAKAVGILMSLQGDREGRIPEKPRAIFILGMPHSSQVEPRSRSQYKERALSVFGQPRRLWGFRWMNRAHSVWGKTLGTVWERLGPFPLPPSQGTRPLGNVSICP